MSKFKQNVELLFSPRYLLYTNIALGGTFLGLGDLIEQCLNKKVFNAPKPIEKTSNEKADKLKEKLLIEQSQIDPNRTTAMAKSGLIIGACGHYWYQFLDRKFPGTAAKTIFKKLACEIAAGPPWILLTFLCVGFFENQPVKESFLKFKNALLIALIADWCFYVPLQSLNFKFVPPRFRFAYVVCLTLVYDSFLAFILHK